MIDLLPCAHCGKSDPRTVMVGYGVARVAEVMCDFCGASAPSSVWNQRYPDLSFSHQPNPPILTDIVVGEIIRKGTT